MIRADVGSSEVLGLFGFVFTIGEMRVGLKTEKAFTGKRERDGKVLCD